MATKNAETPKPATEAVSNDTYIVDNTDIVEQEVVTVETEEVEILGGLVQVNYK
jgi:hypothetical protein